MVLQGGIWEGKQLVSSEWIAAATTEKTRYPNSQKYGYLWWIQQVFANGKVVNMHYADGNGGQYIMVIPEADMVVVFTGENYNSAKSGLPFEIVAQYILPAVK